MALRVRPDDAATLDGFKHFYNMEYEAAIGDFELALKAHQDDPFAVNHLLQSVLLRELDRGGALSAKQYFGDEFLHVQKIPVDQKVEARIKELTELALRLSEQRLRANPNDVDALYARGVTRGLRALYTALAEKAWFAALRGGLGSYEDHDRVLHLSPSYSDAKLVVGLYNYAVGTLPWPLKVAAFLLTITGSKSKGIEYVREAADGGGEVSVDAKTALGLVLGRERRYPEAISLLHWLYGSYPHNFLFGLAEADLLKLAGRATEAIAAYRKLLFLGHEGTFPNIQLGPAAYELGEALRSKREYSAAAEAYESVRSYPNADRGLVSKANLAAGEMYDLLQEHDLAVQKYQQVLAGTKDSREAKTARRLLKHRYNIQ